jgi:hypothetical protein
LLLSPKHSDNIEQQSDCRVDNVTLVSADDDLADAGSGKVTDCEAWSGVGGEGVTDIMSGDAEVSRDVTNDGEEDDVEAPVVNKTAGYVDFTSSYISVDDLEIRYMHDNMHIFYFGGLRRYLIIYSMFGRGHKIVATSIQGISLEQFVEALVRGGCGVVVCVFVVLGRQVWFVVAPLSCPPWEGVVRLLHSCRATM